MSATYPAELIPVFERAITCEYASFTKSGEPIAMPVTPYVGPTGTLDLSTGLTYPTKAERARRNPIVALLYADAKGSGLVSPPVILALGRAAVRDRDLQGNTDRYIDVSLKKLPAATKGTPRALLRTMNYYYARIWVEITPVRLLWWPNGDTDQPPQIWSAPTDTVFPESDPAPQGKPPSAWKENPTDWKPGAQHAVAKLGLPVVTVKGDDGYPYLMRAKSVTLTSDGFALEMPRGVTWNVTGPACLTFSYHPEVFTGQENMMFVGNARQEGPTVTFLVKRRIGDWSAGGDSRMRGLLSFMTAGLKLRARVKEESARRGQPVPKVNLPN